jgi:hypothetical protein
MTNHQLHFKSFQKRLLVRQYGTIVFLILEDLKQVSLSIISLAHLLRVEWNSSARNMGYQLYSHQMLYRIRPNIHTAVVVDDRQTDLVAARAMVTCLLTWNYLFVGPASSFRNRIAVNLAMRRLGKKRRKRKPAYLRVLDDPCL